VLAVTLLIVVVGTVVLATVIGARRSSTALARFNAYSHASDLEVDVDPATTPAQLREFIRSPGVASVAMVRAYAQQVASYPDLQIAAAVDDRIGSSVDRARIVAGRRQNLRDPYEITISEGFAALAHLHIGDHIKAASLAPDQMARIAAGHDPGPARGPVVDLNIVGIIRRPLDLGDRAASGGVVILTPAFYRKYDRRIAVFADVLRVRTVRGQRDVARVSATAQRMFHNSSSFQVTDLALENGGGADAINVVTLALWIFAGVGALAGAVAVGIVLTREVSQAGVEHATLQSLGMSRRSRIVSSMIPPCFAAGAGALLAVIFAIAASPLFPIGIARRADPDPGFHVDWVALGLGVAILGAFVLVIALLAAIRSSQTSSLEGVRRARRRRGPSISESMAHAGFSPSFTSGVRMTFDPGRGDRALPTRSAFLGATFGVVGVTAVLVFAASLGHLASTPRLYGWTFDFKAPDDTFTPRCGNPTDTVDYGLQRVRGVGNVAGLCFAPIAVNSRTVTGWGLTDIRGTIAPEIIAGRAPRADDEVALGATTLAALHKRIGDTVRASAASSPRNYRVVGRAVFPRIYGQELQPLADGALFTGAAFRPFAIHSDNLSRYLVAQFAPNADRAAVLARASKIPAFNMHSGETLLVADQGAHGASVPPEIDRLRHVGWFPPALGALLILLASLAVGHALVTAVRRRRREFALLKTLGFRRRQVRATIAWHATMLGLLSLVVGIPVGVVVGRIAWRLLANNLGVSTTPWIPILAPVLIAAVALLLVNLIALFPAYAAANTRPAVALRTE
jgi:ABC-type lipoprotein release transport system permease subunit